MAIRDTNAARRRLGERMSDFRPNIVTAVLREEVEPGVWRVVRASVPPVLLAENVDEDTAREIQETERERIANLLPPTPTDDDTE